MVRAVEPANPRLNGRVFVVDHGKVQAAAGRPQPASGSTSPPAAASAWASRPPGVDYTAPIFDSKLQPLNTIHADRAALAGAGLRATAATGR